MGWLRTIFLGDIGYRVDNERRKNAEQDVALKRLEHENDQLKLCVGSLMRLLVAKGHLSEQELVAIVDGIDDDEE